MNKQFLRYKIKDAKKANIFKETIQYLIQDCPIYLVWWETGSLPALHGYSDHQWNNSLSSGGKIAEQPFWGRSCSR